MAYLYYPRNALIGVKSVRYNAILLSHRKSAIMLLCYGHAKRGIVVGNYTWVNSQAKEVFGLNTGLDVGFSKEDNDLILVEPSADMRDEILEYKKRTRRIRFFQV